MPGRDSKKLLVSFLGRHVLCSTPNLGDLEPDRGEALSVLERRPPSGLLPSTKSISRSDGANVVETSLGDLSPGWAIKDFGETEERAVRDAKGYMATAKFFRHRRYGIVPVTDPDASGSPMSLEEAIEATRLLNDYVRDIMEG